MPLLHAISIANQRGVNTNYAVFMEPPHFTGGLQPWMGVWQASFVSNQGYFRVDISSEDFAWVVTVSESPAPGVVVNRGMELPVILGTVRVPGSFRSILHSLRNKPSAIRGAFEIKTEDDFPLPNNKYLIGLAKFDHQGLVAPAAVVCPSLVLPSPSPRATIQVSIVCWHTPPNPSIETKAAPHTNMSVQITPKNKFYVTESHQTPGQIVDYNTVTREGATIDFTVGEGEGKFYAEAVQGTDGRFAVKHFDNFAPDP